LITYLLIFVTLLSSVLSSAKTSRHKNRTRPVAPHAVIPYNHATLAAPPGMVYIRGGSTNIKYDQSSTDTSSNSIRKVSLTSFFIDKTEVTNAQYRQFVNWVVDSIAIVKYLKDDKYFIETPAKSGSTENSSNTGTTAIGVNPGDTSSRLSDSAKIASGSFLSDSAALAGVGKTNVVGNDSAVKKRIDWSKVNHNKLWDTKDEETRAKLLPMLDENGNIKKEMYKFSYTYLKPNPSASKKIKNQYKTVVVNVYPDEAVWAEDLPNSQTEMYVENYFKAPPFDDYPVVGVNWVQANVYCHWRSMATSSYNSMPDYMKYYHLVYTLPSEAQWVYASQGYYDLISEVIDTSSTHDSSIAAAPSIVDTTVTPHDSAYVARMLQPKVKVKEKTVDSAKIAILEKRKERKHGKTGNMYLSDYMKGIFTKYGGKYDVGANPRDLGAPYSDSTPIHNDVNGMLENFKQGEGDYWEDGSALPTPVMAFAPNEFGIYNMEGNVSEWVMDAYSPSAYAFVSDLNPVLLYDADSSDADAMKRKVVRGGSFIGNAKSLTPYYRDLEMQNVSHCFIGFRCVMQAPEIIYRNLATRTRSDKGHPIKNGGRISDVRVP
jgi:formylglycine-generating enzyme required for sulfatase activity